MKNNKIIVILIVILAIYGGVMVIFLKKDTENTSKEKYIIIDDYVSYKYNNGTYKAVKKEEIEKAKEYFKAYDDNSYLGEYKLQYVDNWNLFSKDKVFKKYNDFLFAHSKSFDIEVNNIPSRKLNENDKSYIREKYNINNFNHLITEKVYEIDLDNDGNNDEIICLSNSYNYDYYSNEEDENYNQKDNYSLAFIKINDTNIDIIKEIGKEDITVIDLMTIYNINSSNNPNIIIKSIVGYDSDEASTTSYDIYNYNITRKKITKIVPK